KMAKRLTQKLISLYSLARAAGVITIACTQKPSVDVVKSSLRDLLGVRWALRCATKEASDTILPGMSGLGISAHRISATQRGAGYLNSSGVEAEFLRSHFYSPDDIKTIIAAATELRGAAKTLPEEPAPAGVMDLILKAFSEASDPEYLTTADLLAALARIAPGPWADVASRDSRAAGRELSRAIAAGLPKGKSLSSVERSWGRGYLRADALAAAGIAPN
ncbi:hypothetical protein ACFW2I_40690, partial [Streptomyces nigra]|uniref:hypothetical protein n=1 Tax=Streptomyces nigra TaxID=1827580 RepID=UPI003679135E